jgi:hypothetical protein
MRICDAKEKLTIADLGERLFPGWQPKNSCRRPWGEDKNPSFSVFDRFQKWKDHATGEGGDAIDFIQRALHLSKADACRKFIEMADGPSCKGAEFQLQPQRPADPADSEEKKSKRAAWPKFYRLSDEDRESIARIRSLPIEGLPWAVIDGVLHGVVSVKENAPSWVIVSKCKCNAQARRLDGKPYEHNGQQLKAKTLPGSIAQIPVGNYFDARWPMVVILEGGPDVLAAYSAIYRLGLLDKVSVCGMLGAGLKIPSNALAAMAGRRVRILQHNDTAGYSAADGWARQLHGFRTKVDIWTPSADGADLNDVFKLAPEACAQEIGEAFDFAKGGC